MSILLHRPQLIKPPDSQGDQTRPPASCWLKLAFKLPSLNLLSFSLPADSCPVIIYLLDLPLSAFPVPSSLLPPPISLCISSISWLHQPPARPLHRLPAGRPAPLSLFHSLGSPRSPNTLAWTPSPRPSTQPPEVPRGSLGQATGPSESRFPRPQGQGWVRQHSTQFTCCSRQRAQVSPAPHVHAHAHACAHSSKPREGGSHRSPPGASGSVHTLLSTVSKPLPQEPFHP